VEENASVAEEIDDRLPAGLKAAWGVPERPQRGPRPGLSVGRIVEAGVKVATSHGLAAVSMSRVAAELDTGPMSLYRYVGSKEELLSLMADRAYGPAPEARDDDGWRVRLSRWATAELERLTEHQWALAIPIRGLPILPNEVAWFEAALAALGGTGLSEEEKGSVVVLVSGYTRMTALLNADLEAAVRNARQSPQDWLATYARTITRLADARQFPALNAFISSGVFDKYDPPDAEFRFGLDRILDGVGQLIESRQN
jgi:AcrR family transcriptional regulator